MPGSCSVSDVVSVGPSSVEPGGTAGVATAVKGADRATQTPKAAPKDRSRLCGLVVRFIPLGLSFVCKIPMQEGPALVFKLGSGASVLSPKKRKLWIAP